MVKTRFKNLSDTDKSFIKTVHSDKDLGWDHRMSILMNRFNVSERTIRKWISRLGISSYKEIENEEIREGKLRKYDSNKKIKIITWAQNATPVHLGFWKNILKYAEYLDADIGVIQGRYQNPTSLWSSKMESEDWWDNVLSGYLDAGRHNLHPYLDLLSDIKVRPTAVNPLSGFEGISGDRSSIIGHPRVHLRSLPVLKGHNNKFLMTTGACTIKNYTDTKAGKKAEFHHTYGFVIVEISDDYVYHFRQVTALDDGSFIDLNNSVDSEKVTKIHECDAFVLGDIHARNVNDFVMSSTVSLFKDISPKVIILHDIFDGESVNHHESKDPIRAYEKYKSGRNIVLDEVNHLKRFITSFDLLKYNPIVVRSNHDCFLDRWIKDADWKKDIANSKEYMQYSLALLEGKAPNGLIPYILKEEFGDKITTLGLDDSFKINGWELAQHGHLGNNGSRGSIEQYRKLNTKVIIAHSHSPGRKDGALQVGTYTNLRLGYNSGPSSWVHSGAILHKNGKAQHIIFSDNGSFTNIM